MFVNQREDKKYVECCKKVKKVKKNRQNKYEINAKFIIKPRRNKEKDMYKETDKGHL